MEHETLQDLFINLQNSYPGIIQLITSFTFVMGMSLIVAGVYKLKVYGEMRTMMAAHTNLKEPLLIFMTGTVFLYLPTSIDIVMTTIYNSSTLTPLSYITAESGRSAQSMEAILGLVRIVGLISFIRGWFYLMHSGQQGRGGMGKGLTHIIGGALAMNIAATKEVLWTTFGFHS